MPPIITAFERVARHLVDMASEFPSAIIADASGRRGAADGRVQALNRKMRIAGPAVTVEVKPGDNLMLHAALQIAQPGDVIVCDGKGVSHCALVGEMMIAQARGLGLGGIVLDGAVRDVSIIAEQSEFGVFASARSCNGPTKTGPGRINWPTSIGGAAVCAGDLVVGDADGVVFVSRAQVLEVLEMARSRMAAESGAMSAYGRGELKPAWVVEALRAAGVLQPGEVL